MWFELLQGTGRRSPRHFTRTRLFRVHRDSGRWRCQLANWKLEGVDDGRLLLNPESTRFTHNGTSRREPTVLSPLDVVLFDDGLAFRVHDRPAETVALDWSSLEGDGALVAADALLERGDAFGELMANPTAERRAQWLALLLWPPAFGTLEASWNGAGLFALELRWKGGVSSADAATWCTRLPRQLKAARIGEPLLMLSLRAAHFQRRMWREVLEGFVNGLEGFPLEHLESLEIHEGQRVLTASDVLAAPALARMRSLAPKREG